MYLKFGVVGGRYALYKWPVGGQNRQNFGDRGGLLGPKLVIWGKKNTFRYTPSDFRNPLPARFGVRSRKVGLTKKQIWAHSICFVRQTSKS